MVNRKEKGKRNQRKCRDRLLSNGYPKEGIEIQTDNRYGDNDFFNQFDIIAIKGGSKPKFIQVKSNGFSGLSDIKNFVDEYMDLDHCQIEVWAWFDYGGFVIKRLNSNEWNILLDER